jgi:hypothetical protein
MREKISITTQEVVEFDELTNIFEYSEEHILDESLLLMIQSS